MGEGVEKESLKPEISREPQKKREEEIQILGVRREQAPQLEENLLFGRQKILVEKEGKKLSWNSHKTRVW